MRSSSLWGRGVASVLLMLLEGHAAAQTRIDLQRQSNTAISRDSTTGQISATTGFNAPLVAVPFSATPAFDASAGNIFVITLKGNVTSSTLGQPKTGQILTFSICQDNAGGHGFSWPGNFVGAGAVSPAAGACSQQSFVYQGSSADAIGSMLIIGLPGGALTLPGAISGVTSVQPAAVATGTLTLPAATDTLVGRSTAETLQNKTISGTNNTLTPTASQTIAGFSGCGGGRYLKDDGTCGTPAGGGGSAGNSMQVFDASATFTVPEGVNWVYVAAVGGGGSGRGGWYSVGGGGGGGGGARGWCAVTPGGTVTVTVGAGGAGVSNNDPPHAGGTSSFGTCLSASGGTGGGYGGGTQGGYDLGYTGTNYWIDYNSGAPQLNTSGAVTPRAPLRPDQGGGAGTTPQSAHNGYQGGFSVWGGGGGGTGAFCTSSTGNEAGGAGGASHFAGAGGTGGGCAAGLPTVACTAGTVPGGGGGGAGNDGGRGSDSCAGANGRVTVYW